MRAYVCVFRIRFIAGLQYRSAAWAGIATQFCWGFMLIALYWAFYSSSDAAPPMPFPQLVAYVWLQQAFLSMLMLWFQDGELLQSIASGQVAYEMCRPVSLYALWFARLLGRRMANAALRFAPVLIIALLLGDPFRLIPPPDLSCLLLAAVSILCAGALAVAISMFVYILTFLTLSPRGGQQLINVVGTFFSGAVLPIPLMPLWLQNLSNFLPFRYSFDLPLRIYSGNVVGMDALLGVGAQLLWMAGLGIVGYLCLRAVLRRVVIQGG